MPFGGEWNFNTMCRHAVHILVLLIINQAKSSIVMYTTSILLSTKYSTQNNLIVYSIPTCRTLAIARPFEGQVDVTIYK